MEPSKTLNVAIIGGGKGCKALMDLIFGESLSWLKMKIIGVADPDPEAVGYEYALEKGIFTTADYRELYALEDLHTLIEMTGVTRITNEIAATKPPHVRLIDNLAARMGELTRKIRNIRKYKTMAYVRDSRIIDIHKASEDE